MIEIGTFGNKIGTARHTADMANTYLFVKI